MGKTAIWALVGIGFILFLRGIGSGSAETGVTGFLMMLGGFYLALGPEGTLRKEQVVDKWSTLIENAQGNAKMIFKETENFIKKSKAPSIGMKMRNMSPGTFKGLMGIERDFLEITDRDLPDLYECQRLWHQS